MSVTYDHRLKRKGHPVRSAKLKLQIGGLVVGWVTTSEYPLLYVPILFLAILMMGKGVEMFESCVENPGTWQGQLDICQI